jgi:hypothetical protein
MDISRRNYSGMEEFIVETALGTGELLINTSAGMNMLFGGDNESLRKDVTSIKESIQNIRDSYSKDVEFDDAFSSLSNFASFAMQEVSNQIPIFAALAIPGGQAAIGLGAFGDQYINLANERDTEGGRQKSNADIWWSSLGFGASELVFESLTTLPLIRAAKKGFITTPGSKTMFDMTAGKYFQKNIGKTVYGALSEPIGEGMTQLTQNFIDGKPLTQGLDHAMFSGLMFGTTLSSMPFARGLYLSRFNDHVKMKEVRKRVGQMKSLNIVNTNIAFNLKHGRTNLGTQADIDNNNKIITDLQAENLAEMKEVEANISGTSNDALKQYFTLEQAQEEIKNEAQAVVDNKSLKDQQKTDRLKVLQAKFDRAQSAKDFFRDKDAFGDEYTAFSGLDANKDEVAEIEKEARSILNGRGKKDPTKVELFDQAKIIYNTRKINANHAANQRRGLNDVINAQTKDEAIEKVNNLSNVDDDVKKEVIKGIQDGNHGVNIPTMDGRNLPMQVVESMAADDRLETRTHEVGHSVFIKAISQNSKAFDGLADQILEHLKTTNPSAYKRVSFRLGNQTASDEVVMLFLEEVASNKVDIKKSEKAGFFATLMNKGIEEVGGQPIDLRGETDAINFLVGIAKKIKDGTIKTKDIADIRASVIAKEARSTVPQAKTKAKAKASKSTPLEAINELIPKNIKTKEEYDAFVQDRRAFPAVFNATMGDGVISNYVKSKSIGGEYQGAIESVQNRLTNFDPEATRADGTTVGPEGFGEFIFANTRFGKLDSKKKLFEAGEKAKREESIDSAEARQIEDKPTTKRSEPRGQKARILKSLADVNLDNKEIISSTARAEINALIEQNPKNLEAQITSIIDKEITKAVKAQMGKISNVQGEVVISEEYKAFIALNYENIVQSLDVDTIKNNYKTLFELTEIGKEDRRTRKSDKPSLKKDSNYRKAIFKIETNKAKFTKFFTEGGYTTLLARQKGLANQIAKGITEDVINNEIIENSNNIDAVIQAEIADYGNKLNRQKNEVRGNYSDQIKFSKTVNAKHFNELINEGINGEVGSDVWISLVKIANPIIVKEAESIIELHNADYTKETSGFKDRVRRLVFGKGIKEKYFARPTNKNHPDSINELLDFTESLAEIMDPALVSTGLFEDMFGFTYRYGDKNRIGKDAHGRVVDSTSKRKSDKNFIDKHGFDPSTAKKYMFNSTFGIMGRINTITSKSFNTVKEKLQAILDKEGANIEQANKQNYKVLEYIITKAIQVVNKNPDKLVGALRWLESATSTVKGLRGLTRLTHLDVIAESQEPSIEHPDYKETYKVALESVKKKNKTKKLNLTDSQIKEAAKESALAQLKPKGEHLKPSANLMASFAELIIKYSKLDMSNPKTLTEFKKDFNKLTDGYDQALGNKSTYAIVDKTMGSQAEGDVRLLTGLPKAIAKRFFHISGVQSAGYISRTITQSKEFTKLSNRADKAAKLSSAINFSRSANNPTKGITVLDFDDTLATTKSGVRANIPNTDGLPKPGRKVIFLAGGAGSGKGNVISKLGLESQGFKVVNSDISLEWLKKNSGLPENMNDFTEKQRSTLGSLQHQARGIARRKMMKYQGEGGGVVVDGTGGSIKSMENLVNEFKAKGYDVSMVFTETSLDVALERNAARKERSLLDKIVERNHEAVQGNKDGFKEMFGDRFMEVNTDNLSQKDAMPSKLTNKMNDFVSGYENRRLDAEEFARDGASILEQGGTFDFSEFNEVVEGQTAPLFEKAMKLQGKFGNKDMFVLTARPAESADAIHAFLTANGLNIPLKNITGLANSTAEAKALWMVEKVSEGYNDFYFADDAIQNVKAVDNILEQFDVKRKVQQARADFVKGDPQVVKLLEESSMNDVKNVDRLTKPGTYDNIKFSKAHRAEYENTISKNRPDLVKSKLVSKTIDRMFDYIDSLDVPTDKRRKYEKITTKWLATSNVKLGEDGYKIQQAVELAEKHNKDIFSYNNPNEIIEAYAGKSKAEPTNPKNVKEFGEGRVFNKKHGITVHEVEDTKEGMMAVRKVADTHWGPKSNPWCIIARSEKQRVEPRQYGYESVATKAEAQARKQQLESEGFMVEIRAHKKDYRGIYPGKSIDGKRVD